MKSVREQVSHQARASTRIRVKNQWRYYWVLEQTGAQVWGRVYGLTCAQVDDQAAYQVREEL